MTPEEKEVIVAACKMIDADYKEHKIELLERAWDLVGMGRHAQARLVSAGVWYRAARKRARVKK